MIHVKWSPLGYENERAVTVFWPGRWAFMVILPRLVLSRKRRP